MSNTAVLSGNFINPGPKASLKARTQHCCFWLHQAKGVWNKAGFRAQGVSSNSPFLGLKKKKHGNDL